VIQSNVVPNHLVKDVVCLLWNSLRFRGVSAQEWRDWGQQTFPHLVEAPAIVSVVEHLKVAYGLGLPCWLPQIVFALPTEYTGELEPHVDVPPQGKQFTRILGLALTQWTEENGAVHLWQDNVRHCAMCMNPGDVLDLPVDAKHSPGINTSDHVRIGLYVRWAK
jgi:hypothetical protein